MPAPPDTLSVSFVEAPAAGALEAQWRALEARSDTSFFTTWTWVGSWLRQLPASVQPMLLRAVRGHEVVGLALLAFHSAWRHGFLKSRSLFLHATGDPVCDDITVEYNGFLVDHTMAATVQQQMLQHLVHEVDGWEEAHFESLARPLAAPFSPDEVLTSTDEQPCFHVCLDKVRSQAGGYMALLRHKPRYNVRRSLKACAEFGEIALDVAQTPDQAMEHFEGLKRLHTVYWHSRGMAGAFASGFANAFHAELIAAGLPRGEIQLVHVRAGTRTLGYLYNFVHRGRVMNYQAGIDYMLPSVASPGLAAHALAVELNASLGHALYDFMMGDQQYKRQLCTDKAGQYSLVLRRDRLKFRVEDTLKKVRDRLRDRSGRLAA